MEKTTQEKINELEEERQELLNIVNAEYYNRKLPQYLDNDRFSWAISLINKKFDQRAAAIIRESASQSINPTVIN